MSKKESFPEFDLVMNMLRNKVGSFIEPCLFHVSSGSRKGSSNFHFAGNGMYFYGNIKKQHVNDAGNTCLTLRCPNFQAKKCHWTGRLEYKNGTITIDNDEFFDATNWTVVPNPSTAAHVNLSGKPFDELPTTLKCRDKSELARCCDKNPCLVGVKVRFTFLKSPSVMLVTILSFAELWF